MDGSFVKSQHRMPATGAGIVSVKGAAGPARCATRGQTDMRGSFSAAGPVFVVRARCLGSSVTAETGAHSRTADALARECRMVPAASLTDVVQGRSVGVRG